MMAPDPDGSPIRASGSVGRFGMVVGVDEQDVTGCRGRTVDYAEEEDPAWR